MKTKSIVSNIGTYTFGLVMMFALVAILAGCVNTTEPTPEPRFESEARENHMKNALQQYIDGFNQGDAAMLIALFADNAKIEDPIGGGRVVKGKEAITAFYQRAVTMVERLELDTPIRGSYGHSAAMAFTIHLKKNGEKKIIQAIDVMTFDDSGKIIDMKAFHGPSNASERIPTVRP